MVHLKALPGAPAFDGAFERVLEAALDDARALEAGGVDAILLENFGDTPFYPDSLPPETVAAMARVLGALAEQVTVPLGVNCLRNDARSAVGLCATGEASFFRVNVHTGATVTDQGLLEGRAFETLRERDRLAPGAALLADVQVKHGRPLAERTLLEEAKDTWFRGRADALVVSGVATGAPPSQLDLETLTRDVPEALVYVGSGLSLENASDLLSLAHGAIVGTALKVDGDVSAPVDVERVRKLAEAFADQRPS